MPCESMARIRASWLTLNADGFMQAEVVMGDALREQGKDPSQLELTVDSDGARGSSAPGWGSMKPERGRGRGGRRALRCFAGGRA